MKKRPKQTIDAQAPREANVFAGSVGKSAPQKTEDGFQNFAAKLGVGPGRSYGNQNNLLSQGHYEFNLVTRNRVQLEAAYRGSWIVGQVIDTVAEDMTRAGIEITTNQGAEDVPDFMIYLTRKQLWQSLCNTIKWARLYGGAVAVMQIEGQDLSKPLDASTVGRGQFKGLVVYDRWQIWPVLSELINSGPNIGLPAYYDVVLGSNINDPGQLPGGAESNRPNAQVRIHHSRCVRMEGLHLPFWQAITEMMWGESVLERMWDRLIAFDTASLATGGLINRANLRMVGINGLREILAAGGKAQEALVKQFEYVREFQSNEGLTLLDKEDEYQTTSYSFAGLADVLIQFGQQVSGSAQIPLVRLFGQSPTGLNSNGDADIRQYYDSVLQKQEATMRDPLEKILKISWQSFTGQPCPEDLAFEFTPLWQMSAEQKATVAKTNTDTILEVQQAGIIDTATALKELKQASGQHGLFTHITDDDIAAAEALMPPSPEELGINTQTTGDPGSGPATPAEQIASHVTGGQGSLTDAEKIAAHVTGEGKEPSHAEQIANHVNGTNEAPSHAEQIANHLEGGQEDDHQAFIKSKVTGDSAWKRFKRWVTGDNFSEGDHPRSGNGQFGKGSGKPSTEHITTAGSEISSTQSRMKKAKEKLLALQKEQKYTTPEYAEAAKEYKSAERAHNKAIKTAKHVVSAARSGDSSFSQEYQGHKIEVIGGKLFIDGEEQTGNFTGVSTAVSRAKHLIDKKGKGSDQACDPGKNDQLPINPDEYSWANSDSMDDREFIAEWLRSGGGVE